jgi:KipI family sensor histidine kinase inhibitor
LVEVDSLDEVDAVRTALAGASEAGRLPDLIELVPAARTVLAAMRPGSGGLAKLRETLAGVDLTASVRRTPREVELPVHYDGPDRELVAKTAGISVDEVGELHSSVEYSVAFCGFAPGFGYLVGLPESLCQPRLERPRTKVPVGSVGIADEFTGAYPRSSPGGWRLIGRTEAALFDSHRERPALLAPGDIVRFTVAT